MATARPGRTSSGRTSATRTTSTSTARPTPTTSRPSTTSRSSTSTTAPTPATTSTPTTNTAIHKLPGPRFYRLIRAALVVLTLVSSLICVIAIQASQNSQASMADSLVSTQNLHDLQVEVAQAESVALVWMADPTEDTWQQYLSARAQIDLLLMASAASAKPTDLNDVANALRDWQDAVTIAYYHGSKDTDDDAIDIAAITAAITMVDNRYNNLTSQLAKAITNSTPPSGSSPLTVIGLVAAVMALLGFVGALVLVAMRSHRIINLGLAIGLLAVIGIVAVMGAYHARPQQILTLNSQTTQLSQAAVDTWNTRSLNTLSILLPSRESAMIEAETIANSLHRNPVIISQNLTAQVSGLVARQQEIMNASESELVNQVALVANDKPWQTLATAIEASITSQRTDPPDLIASAQWSLVTVFLLCVTAAIATPAGINSRTKEYR